jgi:hypothetical protein
MVEPVQPVIQKVFTQNQNYPVPYTGIPAEEPVIIKKQKNSHINNPETQVDACIEQHEVNITCCVFPGV